MYGDLAILAASKVSLPSSVVLPDGSIGVSIACSLHAHQGYPPAYLRRGSYRLTTSMLWADTHIVCFPRLAARATLGALAGIRT